ncbi:MAG: hypothetical protein KDA24_23480 [Deltaproteobacteria bacterium]|nr:hypothetical protein [Deltaproteobacteria bacterium]
METRPLAMDLYSLLREMDPGRWRTDSAQATAEHLARFKVALDDTLAALESRIQTSSPDEELRTVRARLAEIQEIVGGQVTASAAASREQWMALRVALLPRYESLRSVLRTEAVHVPALRPTNYRRSLVHVTSGFVAFTIISLLPGRAWLVGIASLFFVYAWVVEFIRRRSPSFNARVMAFYAPIAHAHEWDRVNSGTWYCTALFIIAMTGSPLVCAIAVLILGVSDPMAALIGRRWGKTKLVNGRSLEGTLAFAVSGTLVASLMSAWVYPISLPQAFALAGVAGVAGAIAELFSRSIDDNLTIPVAAGGAAWLLSLVLL